MTTRTTLTLTTLALATLSLAPACDDPGNDGGVDRPTVTGTLTVDNCATERANFVACGGDVAGEWHLASACVQYGDTTYNITDAGAPVTTLTIDGATWSLDSRGGAIQRRWEYLKGHSDNPETCDATCREDGEWCRDCTESNGSEVVAGTVHATSAGPATVTFDNQFPFPVLAGWSSVYELDYCASASTLVLRGEDGIAVLKR